jgi:hypothetical protein
MLLFFLILCPRETRTYPFAARVLLHAESRFSTVRANMGVTNHNSDAQAGLAGASPP